MSLRLEPSEIARQEAFAKLREENETEIAWAMKEFIETGDVSILPSFIKRIMQKCDNFSDLNDEEVILGMMIYEYFPTSERPMLFRIERS